MQIQWKKLIIHISDDLKSSSDSDDSDEEWFLFKKCTIALLIFFSKHSGIVLLFWLWKKPPHQIKIKKIKISSIVKNILKE